MLILGSPKVQIFRDGELLVGGKVYVYDAGTATPRASYPTWDDATNETNANANPVILDSRGEANIVLKGPSKVEVKDADDVTLWSVDDLDADSIDVISLDGGSLLTFTGVASAVNHFQMSNSALGTEVTFEAVGDDTNIGVEIKCQADEDFTVENGDLEITVGNVIITSGDFNITSGDVNALNGTVNLSDGDINVQTAGFSFLPAGTVMWHGGSSAPAGWLECDGSAVSRSTYGTLFTNIGTAFGVGDGSTTFNLPAQARRTLVGKGGSGTGELGNAIGDTGGEESHTLTEAEMPSHTHTMHLWNADTAFADYADGSTDSYLGTQNDTQASVSAGSGDAYNTLQPSIVSMLIVRAY